MVIAEEENKDSWILSNSFIDSTLIKTKKRGHEELKTHTQPLKTYQRVESSFKKKIGKNLPQ